MPIISWFGSISSPRRAAKLVEVAIVSVSDTSTIPSAAISSGPRSLTETCGIDGVGRPWGNAPTVFTPFSPRSSSAVATVAPTTATSTAGTRVVIRGRINRTASAATPITSAVVFVWSSPDTNAFVSSMKPSASVENPKSFGSWPTMIVIARPFMYPTCTSLDRRSATNPSLPRPSPISIAPTISAIIPARAIAVLGSGTRRGARSPRRSGATRTNRVPARGSATDRGTRSPRGTRSSCRGPSPVADPRARRTPCPAERGSPRARPPRSGRAAATKRGRCGACARPAPTGRRVGSVCAGSASMRPPRRRTIATRRDGSIRA